MKQGQRCDKASSEDGLHASTENVIEGRAVQFESPTWMTSLQFQHELAPFVRDLEAECCESDDRPSWPAMALLTYRHRDVMLSFMADRAGCDRQWIEQLSPEDGERFFDMFWKAYSGFFVLQVQLLREERQSDQPRAGEKLN